jgi:5'-nucleotidase
MEGTFLSIPSIALSQAYGHHEDDSERMYWECAETHAARLIKQILDAGIAPNTFVNINFPDCPADQVAGTVATVQGRRDAQTMKIDPRYDGRGNPYYWIAFERFTASVGAGTDLEALRSNRISVTPLRIDMTDEASIARYTKLFG